jgi:hypothetical protein
VPDEQTLQVAVKALAVALLKPPEDADFVLDPDQTKHQQTVVLGALFW